MPLAPLRAGDPTRVGGYRLTARLGAGAMGVVFLGVADDTSTVDLRDALARPGPTPGHRPAETTERLVAVKLIHERIAAQHDYRTRFRREVVAARAVAGTCAARVLAADPDAPRPWLATEYIAGPSLAEAVDLGGPFAPATVEALAVGLAEALVAIHSAGIVHRDLKPANVLITAAGPKVIDFGMAVPTDPAAAVEVTRTGTVVGSPGYLAPEQAEGRRATPAADVWAWALTVGFAATGRPPFGTGTAEVLLYRSMTTEADLAGVSPRLLAVLRSTLRRDPASRPPAARLLATLVGDTADPAAAAARMLEVLWQPPVTSTPTPGSTPTGAGSPPPPRPHPAAAYPAARPPAGPVPTTAGTPVAFPTGPAAPAPASQPIRSRRGWLAAAGALLAAALTGAGVAIALTGDSHGSATGPNPTATTATATQTPAADDAQGVVGAGDTELLAGRFTGTYTCQQGPTALRLDILDLPEAPGQVTALFSFSATADNPDVPSGAYTMSGTLRGDALELTGRRWLVHPSGYLMVALSGTYSADAQLLRGHVDGAGCETFVLTKSP